VLPVRGTGWIGHSLVVALLGVSLAACRREAAPAPNPAPPAEQEVSGAEYDAKPVVREFLKSLPADWYLIEASAVASAKPFVLDVRQPEEYREGFIAGAVNIPLRDLATSLRALPATDQPVVVVCDTGHRSAIGMAVLRLLGYRGARTLDGGMRSWQQSNLAVTTAPIPTPPTGAVPTVNAQLQARLDYYLRHDLPPTWGAIDAPALTRDQAREPPTVMDPGSTQFEQGHSFLTDVDEPSEYDSTRHRTKKLAESMNFPLRSLTDTLDRVPIREAVAQS
jgi:rhodanese-related sulfurtransferase